MGTFSFGKAEKLCSHVVIEALFAHGTSFKAYPIRVFVLPNSVNTVPAQVLISVPKKRVRSSPGRNRIKRLIRETYRLNKPDLIAKWKTEEKHFAIGFVYLSDKEPEYMVLNGVMKEIVKRLSEL
jgi:ribonuclease P protein component